MKAVALFLCFALAGCSTAPTGPTPDRPDRYVKPVPPHYPAP